MLDITVTEADDHVVVRPAGELDAYTVAQFREALGELAGTSRVLIDLSEVPFMDSAGLGALIGAIRRIRDAGGEVAVSSTRAPISRLLHTTGFDRIVTVADSPEGALAALREG